MESVGQSILLVEDEPIIRDSLAGLLGLEGYHVVAVDSVYEARMAQPLWFDLLLTDIRLLDGSGLELVRETSLLTPCIVMTAFSSDDSVIEALRCGAVDYLKKPFEHAYLLERVALLMAQKRVLLDKTLSLDEYFMRVYKEYHGHVTEEKMAQILGITRKTLFNKRKQLGLD
jgi:DNA-binding NtrC family response regulator